MNTNPPCRGMGEDVIISEHFSKLDAESRNLCALESRGGGRHLSAARTLLRTPKVLYGPLTIDDHIWGQTRDLQH